MKKINNKKYREIKNKRNKFGAQYCESLYVVYVVWTITHHIVRISRKVCGNVLHSAAKAMTEAAISAAV